MKWEGQRQSSNVEDRRAGGGMRVGGRGIGIGTIVIALLASWLFGINPLAVIGLMGGVDSVVSPPQAQAPGTAPPPGDKQAAFVATVLADTEDVWRQVLRTGGATYREPTLVLFRGATRSGCGVGQSAMGPFYCPADEKVYLDLGFFDTLRDRLGAPGDFAQAYVIAHEVGHHVQHLLGITQRVDALRGRVSEREMNALSVRVELQADCFAGVWAHRSQRGKNWLEHGDLEEALNAAARIGDDTLQRRSQGHVVPDSFTHGTSEQRMRWFRRGFDGGSLAQCDTFTAAQI